MIETGQAFPDFALPNQDGTTLRLSDFAGKWLVVYVYPKDDTPAARSRQVIHRTDDSTRASTAADQQDASSRTNSQQVRLPPSTSSPTERELLDAMGAGQSEFRGTMYWNRTTFVVGPDGTVRKTYANVSPQGHERVLLDDIKAMQ